MKPRGLDDLILVNGFVVVILQKFLDFHSIRTQLPQESSCLKGTLTGTHVKILGIQNNTGHQSLGLNGQHIVLFQCVLQKLRHQF